MVKKDSIVYLQGEIRAIDKLLEEIPSESVIERSGLEARKKELTSQIRDLETITGRQESLSLVFRGKPVEGNNGIFADFAAKALEAFTESIAALGADQVTVVGSRGAIPERQKYRMIITGTAIGSFGFELAEASKENTLLSTSTITSAVEQAGRIIEASSSDDEDLTDAVANISPRAVETFRNFLQVVADNEAYFRLEFRDKVRGFSNTDDVRKSEERLRQDNIHEDEVILRGYFLGVLPKRRTFEFEVEESQEIISGKVVDSIEDAAIINGLIGKLMDVKIHVRHVGKGTPRYYLHNI